MNRLIHETSPYLLQHAHNPVDWHPWGEEALSRAKKRASPFSSALATRPAIGAMWWKRSLSRMKRLRESWTSGSSISRWIGRNDRTWMNFIWMPFRWWPVQGDGRWPSFWRLISFPFMQGPISLLKTGWNAGFPQVLITVSDYYNTHQEEIKKMERQMKDTLRQIVENYTFPGNVKRTRFCQRRFMFWRVNLIPSMEDSDKPQNSRIAWRLVSFSGIGRVRLQRRRWR